MNSHHKLVIVILICTLLQGCFRILPSNGGGEISGSPERKINSLDILLPDGYEIQPVVSGLTFPTGIAFNAEGVPFVIESGYSYGEVFLEPKLLRIEPTGTPTVIFRGEKNGPWNGITYDNGYFYIAEGGQLEGGKILKVNEQGEAQVLVDSLPGMGDHHTNGLVVRDGFVYFGQGTATNSGVVGVDNAEYGWLERFPEFHDIPCKDIRVKDVTFTTPNALTSESKDEAITAPFSPYGQSAPPNGTIPGELPCSGAIMRVPIDGGDLELVAWGLRNPYGLALSAENQIFITENSYDVRGSRPVWGTADVLWRLENDMWYGWPDYNAGLPIHLFEVPGDDDPQQILAEHPGTPPKPIALLGVHSSSNGIAFPTGNFDEDNFAFIAQFGDMAPKVGKVLSPVGFKIVRVNIENGEVEDFVSNKGKKNGPASWHKNGGLERPVSVNFSPDGAMYIVDFGILKMDKKGVYPLEKTGVIWKVIRTE